MDVNFWSLFRLRVNCRVTQVSCRLINASKIDFVSDVCWNSGESCGLLQRITLLYQVQLCVAHIIGYEVQAQSSQIEDKMFHITVSDHMTTPPLAPYCLGYPGLGITFVAGPAGLSCRFTPHLKSLEHSAPKSQASPFGVSAT